MYCEASPNADTHGCTHQRDVSTYQSHSTLAPLGHISTAAAGSTHLAAASHTVSACLSNPSIVTQTASPPAGTIIAKETVAARYVVGLGSNLSVANATPSCVYQGASPSTEMQASSCPVPPASTPVLGPFSLPSGLAVSFVRSEDQWLAEVEDTFLVRKETLPVVCKGDVASVLSGLQRASGVAVSHRIHIISSDPCAKHVYVGSLGVLGGGKKGKKKGTKKNNKSRNHASVSQTQDNSTHDEDIAMSRAQIQLLIERAKKLNTGHIVMQTIEECRQYCNGNMETISNLSTNNPGTTNLSRTSRVNQIGVHNNENLDRLLCSLFDNQACISDGHEKNEEDILRELLQVRANYIKRRCEDITEFLDHEYDGTCRVTVPIPISSYLLEVLYADKERKTSMSNVCRNINLRFQALNTLIINIFYKCIAQEVHFSAETKRLLDSAKDLHLALSGEEIYSGNADDLTPYSKIDALFRSIEANPQKLKPALLFQNVLSLRRVRDAIEKGSLHESGPNRILLSYYKGATNSSERVEALNKAIPSASLLGHTWHIQKAQLFSDCYAKHFSEFVTKKDPVVETDTEKRSWLDGFIASLKKSNEKDEEDLDEALFQEDSFFAHHTYEDTSDNDPPSKYASSATPSGAMKRPAQPDHNSKATTLDDVVSYSHKELGTTQTNNQDLAYLDQLMKTVSNKHTDTLCALFSGASRPNIAYQDYANLWIALGGQIRFKAGSHRSFFSPQGHFVGSIHELHGTGSSKDRYTPKAIKSMKNYIERISQELQTAEVAT